MPPRPAFFVYLSFLRGQRLIRRPSPIMRTVRRRLRDGFEFLVLAMQRLIFSNSDQAELVKRSSTGCGSTRITNFSKHVCHDEFFSPKRGRQ